MKHRFFQFLWQLLEEDVVIECMNAIDGADFNALSSVVMLVYTCELSNMLCCIAALCSCHL